MKNNIALLAAGLLLATSAQATVYTFHYTASIEQLMQGANNELVSVGASTVSGIDIVTTDTIVGSFSYDSANTDQWSQYFSASYNRAIYGDQTVAFSMGIARTGQAGSSTSTSIQVTDSRNPAMFTDSVNILGSGGIYSPGGEAVIMTVGFNGDSVDVLSRARLPGEELLAFENGDVSLEFRHILQDYSYEQVVAKGHITSIKLINSSMALSPVPEPGTYAMLLVGLGLLAWQRRRHG